MKMLDKCQMDTARRLKILCALYCVWVRIPIKVKHSNWSFCVFLACVAPAVWRVQSVLLRGTEDSGWEPKLPYPERNLNSRHNTIFEDFMAVKTEFLVFWIFRVEVTSTLKMEAARSSETLVSYRHNTRSSSPERKKKTNSIHVELPKTITWPKSS
jgi:hypothetical protein